MKRFFLAAITCIAYGTLCGLANAETRWDMPIPSADDQVQTKIVREFLGDVGNRSSNALQITLHSNQSLIRQSDTLDALKSNVVSIAAVNADEILKAYFKVDSSALGLTALNYQDSQKLYQSYKDKLAAALDKDNLTLLAAVPHMSVGIFSPRPLNSINEMRRQYFSSTETGLDTLAKALDSTLSEEPAKDIPAGQFNFVFATAQIGDIAALKAQGITSFYDVKVLVPHDLILVRKDMLNGLPEAERRALRDGAVAIDARAWEILNEDETAALAKLKENAIQVVGSRSGLGEDFKALAHSIAEENSASWKEKGIVWPVVPDAATPKK